MTFLPALRRSAHAALLVAASPLAALVSLAALAAPLAPLRAQLAVAPAPATAPACGAGPTVLVLPGGGVRGMAHVGVIEVLDSLGVVPDMVVGTSMGAIVGALYASGYSGHEIERLTRRHDLGQYVGRYAPRAPRALGPQPPLLLWEEGEGGALDLETAAAQEGRINAILDVLMLRGNLVARGDFDRLPIPFRAVATDLRTGERVTLAKGDLAQAVRASFAIPLVFDPMPLDGRTLVDGGIAENVPVRLARELGATHVILSGLTLGELRAAPSTPEIAQRMIDLLFEQSYPPLADADLDIESHVDDATNLDFRDSTVQVMIERGREAARSALADLAAREPATLACLTSADRQTRRALAVATPPLARPLLARGASYGARRFVEKTLGAREGGTLPFDTLEARLSRLGDVEAIRAAWLHPVAAGDSAVALAPVLRLAPRRALGAGLAFDNDLGGRAWAGIVDRRLLGRPVEAAVRGIAGQWRQDVALELRKSVEDVRDARAPFVLANVSREDIRLFDERGVALPQTEVPRVAEALGVVGIDMPRGDGLEMQATALVRHWTNERVDATLPADDVSEKGTALGVGLRVRAGDATRRAMGFTGEWTPRYARGLLTAAGRVDLARWQADGALRLGIAGRDTPLTGWLALGGTEGFAGLRMGERLGRAETSASVDLSRAVLGPVRLHTTFMGGQVSSDPAHPLDGEWLAGVRIGFGAETPIGPVRAQYGVNGDRRTQWYLRVGRWF